MTPPNHEPDEFEQTGRKVGATVGAMGGRLFGWIPAKHRKTVISALALALWTFAGDPYGIGSRQAAAWFSGPASERMRADMKADLDPQLEAMRREIKRGTETTDSVRAGVQNLFEISAASTWFDQARKKVQRDRAAEARKLKEKKELLSPSYGMPFGTGSQVNPNEWEAYEYSGQTRPGVIQ